MEKINDINKEDVKRRFRRSSGSYDRNALAQKRIVDYLIAIIEKSLPDFRPRKILEVGCGTGLLTRRLTEIFEPAIVYVNDLVEDTCHHTAVKFGIPEEHCLCGDIEEIGLPAGFDLIVSASTFQWLTLPALAVRKFANSLADSGILLFNTFGEKNLQELCRVTGKSLYYPAQTEWQELLASCFHVLHHEEAYYPFHFSHPLEILKHLKDTGVNATQPTQFWTRKKLEQFVISYERYDFADTRQYPLTYHALYFVCRKK